MGAQTPVGWVCGGCSRGSSGGSAPASIGASALVVSRPILAWAPVLADVRADRVERLGHVPLAQVPGLRADAVLHAVVVLGVADQAGALLGEERRIQPVAGGGPRVEVEAVEPDVGTTFSVVLAQPLQERDDLVAAPRPAREAGEAGERGRGVGVLRCAARPAVGAAGGGPVGLDGDRAEPLLLDEPLRDVRADGVELGGPVGGLAEQDAAGVADAIDQRVEVAGRAGQLVRGGTDRGGVVLAAHADPVPGGRGFTGSCRAAANARRARTSRRGRRDAARCR